MRHAKEQFQHNEQVRKRLDLHSVARVVAYVSIIEVLPVAGGIFREVLLWALS